MAVCSGKKLTSMSVFDRLFPNLVVLILFCTFILPWVGTGPLWNQVVKQNSDICKKTWWRNLLFIYNYFGFENMVSLTATLLCWLLGASELFVHLTCLQCFFLRVNLPELMLYGRWFHFQKYICQFWQGRDRVVMVVYSAWHGPVVLAAATAVLCHFVSTLFVPQPWVSKTHLSEKDIEVAAMW